MQKERLHEEIGVCLRSAFIEIRKLILTCISVATTLSQICKQCQIAHLSNSHGSLAELERNSIILSSFYHSVMVASVIQVRRISKHLFEYNLSKENHMVHGGIEVRRI